MNSAAERQVLGASNDQAAEAGKLELKHEFTELRAKGWRPRKRSRMRLELSARVEAEIKAAAAEAKLDMIEQRAVINVVHSDQVADDRRRRSWLSRLLGRE